jgi:hypothetical protein
MVSSEKVASLILTWIMPEQEFQKEDVVTTIHPHIYTAS